MLASPAVADILVGNSANFEPRTIRRYRESDGFDYGIAGTYPVGISKGITLGPDGMLYTVGENFGSGFISKSNPVTGQSLGYLVDPNAPANAAFQQPFGITYNPNGSIFATSRAVQPDGVTGVVRFNGTTGTFDGVVIAPGDNGLGFTSDVYTMPGTNDLLVSSVSRVNRYDENTLAFLGTFVTAASAGAGGLQFTTFGPDGNFYASDTLNNRVLRFNGSTGAFMGTFIAGIPQPFNIAFGNDGGFFAVSRPATGPARVLEYNGITGDFTRVFVPPNSSSIPNALHLIAAPNIPEPTPITLLVLASINGLTRRRSGQPV